MEYTDPSPRARCSTGKRKRTSIGDASAPDSPWPSRTPGGANNPFGLAPGARLRLSIVGLSDTDEDPTRGIKHFPHRGLDRGALGRGRDGGGDERDHSEGDGGKINPWHPRERKTKGRVPSADRGAHLEVLLRSVHVFLDRGDVAKAARAFGTILQLRPGSRPVDLRQHNLWAIGAEILMRQDETPPRQRSRHGEDADAATDNEAGDPGLRAAARWGSPANMAKVKAYLETLIQRHPYDHKFPCSLSALDFQLAMLGCEMYNVHGQHASAIARAEEEASARHGQRRLAEGLEPAPVGRGPGLALYDADVHALGEDERQARLRAQKDELRMQALAAMRDITQRMDSLMQAPPYHRNNHILRLRATASLYMADLVVPASQANSTERSEAESRRQLERQVAIEALEKAAHNRGDMDSVSQAILGAQADKDEHLPSPSSLLRLCLPIRGA